MFFFKATGISYAVKQVAGTVPGAYNYLNSTSQLSDERRNLIEKRRALLKAELDDLPIVKIIIEELLAYKPNSFTLDDRLLQLEQLMDAVDKARTSKEVNQAVSLCRDMAWSLAKTAPSRNSFLECLSKINNRVYDLEPISNKIRSKL